MRVLFAGTPEVAVPSFDALLASPHKIVAVLTRPDARVGRSRSLTPSPVRVRAEQAGIEVLTPARPRDEEFLNRLTELAPDACGIVAYGGLIPRAALDIPRLGWVNLHFSLLPAWRGAAPVQHALIAGDEMTGATTFLLEEGLDTGPVLGHMTERIRPRDTAGDLLGRLAEAGAPLLVGSLDALETGAIAPVPQPTEGISFAPKLTVDDARIRWGEPAYAVDRRIRGCTPAPGGWTTFRGERLKLAPVAPFDPVPLSGERLAPGRLRADKRTVLVGTATTPVLLTAVQPQGKKPMPAADWARGVRVQMGERLGDGAPE